MLEHLDTHMSKTKCLRAVEEALNITSHVLHTHTYTCNVLICKYTHAGVCKHTYTDEIKEKIGACMGLCICHMGLA